MKEQKLRIGITLGDPAGIGPEIALKAVLSKEIDTQEILVFGDKIVLEQAAAVIGQEICIRNVDGPDDYQFSTKAIHLIDCGIIKRPAVFGKVSEECGKSAYLYIQTAIQWALRGWIDTICTAPIQKSALQLGGCPHLDHTTILKVETYSSDATTVFVIDNLRVFFLTRHIPLKDISQAITSSILFDSIKKCLGYLEKLGIRNPRLAVAALNPHGGEDGLLGSEEKEHIGPGVDLARQAGYDVIGPIPADCVFHQAKEGLADGVLSLYHDQGHIAAKTLDFHNTVSLTMGLPFLRTSVDHGTAFDIAGKGIADNRGMIQAVLAAARYGWPGNKII